MRKYIVLLGVMLVVGLVSCSSGTSENASTEEGETSENSETSGENYGMKFKSQEKLLLVHREHCILHHTIQKGLMN